MKRVIAALVGTVAGLVALLSFKSHSAVTNGSALPSAVLPSGTAAATGSTSSTARTFVGSAEQTRYGVVQVKITVSGSRITDAAFVQLTAYDGHSEEINSAAGPILLQQTLSAQSAHIDGVSGATYTSDGYEQSLQSALDQAGIK